MDKFRMRLLFVSALLGIALIAVAVRLFTIQIVRGESYALRSKEQVQSRRIVKAKRGGIYDRKGRQLAVSVPGQISLDLNVLGADAGASGKALLQRIYPAGDIAGPVIGYVGKDGNGFSGIEYTFDHYLSGEDGWVMAKRDGKQRTYRKIGLPGKEPKDGADVYLTVDLNLQRIVQAALKQAVEAHSAKGAMAVVMDPHTGKILAMANEPSFNPNVASMFSPDARQNKCVSLTYEPGSTFKAITAAAALQEKMFNEDDLIDGNKGVFEIYGQVIRDDVPQDLVTFTRALAVSSNVCFARIANGFSNDMFFRYSRDFGFGAKTRSAFQGEEAGTLHPVRSWSGRTRVTMAYGYELSATFLQMMMAYAAIVNDGVLLTPIICERIERRDGAVTDAAEVKPVRRVISEETARRLRRMMREVVESGTGKQAAVSGVAVGGKTGTSRKIEQGEYSRERHWSSFIGFLPVETPVLLCGVVVDEPAGAAGGGAAAAPVFKRIMSQALSHPELEFSEKILERNPAAGGRQERQARIPDFAGRTRKSAAMQLDSVGTPYRFVGGGDVVRHQTPAAGSLADDRAVEIVLFTDDRARIVDSAVTVVPDAVGKDLRDAFNIFNASGVRVYAVGRGTVKRQSIPPGEILTSAKVCTLYTDRK